MNKKRFINTIVLVVVVTTIFVGFSKKVESQTTSRQPIRVGLVTDLGNIDDKGFNQGTWEGIQRAAKDFNLDSKYIKPTGETEAEYTKAIYNLIKFEVDIIVTPGSKFQSAIFKAQEKYKDKKFILLDGVPTQQGITVGKTKVADNTVSILFAEHEAVFLAAVATALQIKQGDVGFIGGMEIPPVQRFNWGFQQGIKYANTNLGTDIELKPENVIYQGTFTNVSDGQLLAHKMYDRGVKAIFSAAGGVGIGVINEAKRRAIAGEKVWTVGVDKDQYDSGVYKGNNSVVLTSAVKKIDNATYDMIKNVVEGSFQGGKILLYDVKNDGIGIPKENPNLTADTIEKVHEIYEKMKSGNIIVAAEKGDLIK